MLPARAHKLQSFGHRKCIRFEGLCHSSTQMNNIWLICAFVSSVVVHAMATTVLSLPADVAVPGERQANRICSSCCQQLSYCNRIDQAEDVTVGSSRVSVPKNTAMTCILRDRNVPGSMDGGLCVPDVAGITTSTVVDFCLNYLQVTANCERERSQHSCTSGSFASPER